MSLPTLLTLLTLLPPLKVLTLLKLLKLKLFILKALSLTLLSCSSLYLALCLQVTGVVLWIERGGVNEGFVTGGNMLVVCGRPGWLVGAWHNQLIKLV